MTAGKHAFSNSSPESRRANNIHKEDMKQLSIKRLEGLEGKIGDNEDMVQAIFFHVIDASKKAIEQQEAVNQWIFPPLIIDRLPGETDEAFSDRAAIQARKTMKNPFSVPVLFSN